MITSNSNVQVKNIINLLKKSGERKRCGLFVIEGIKMFEEAPKDRIAKVYVSESFALSNKEKLLGISYEMVSDRVFEQMSDTKTPQGIMATVKMHQYSFEDIVKDDDPFIMILENVQDPGNLGTIMRTAEGAGVSGIIMTSQTVDIYNPKTIRSTMGSLYRVPFIYTDNLDKTVNTLKERGVTVYAAHLKGSSYYDGYDYTSPTAFMIGNESRGLSEEISARADKLLKIPMEGQLESLNAAVSSAILMYETSRQRRIKNK